MKKIKFEIDPSTGLPALPEGQHWEVEDYYSSFLTLYLKHGKNHYESSHPLHIKNGKPITKEDILKAAIYILTRNARYAREKNNRKKTIERKKAVKTFFWNLIFIKVIREWLQKNSEARKEAQIARYRNKNNAEDAKWRAERQLKEDALEASKKFIGGYPPKNLNDL